MALPSPDTKSKSKAAMISPAILELLASRICHDLISPVGAVHNGVEFLEEMGEIQNDAISLIAHSAQQASAKLQAFRFAYGAGGRDPNIQPEDVYNTFNSLIQADDKIKQDWDPHVSIGYKQVPAGLCKIIMGGLILAQECLPRGGVVKVLAGETPKTTLIIAQGEDAALRPNVAEAIKLNLDLNDLDPRTVHPYVLSILADSHGFWIEVSDESPNEVVISLKHKS